MDQARSLCSVGVQLLVAGLYLPPVLKSSKSTPPQMIISVPVQTAVWRLRADGALVVLVAVQLSVLGLYRAPVFNKLLPSYAAPNDHLGTCSRRRCARCVASGALLVVVGVQLSVLGLYLSACVKPNRCYICPAPDDHLSSSPDRRMTESRRGRVGSVCRCPSVNTWIVLATAVAAVRILPRR